MSSSHQVIVVGAGFAGLSAATELASRSIDVVVLEARDRVGGRVESLRNALGERFDSGGQFFCDDMTEVTALARRHGKTFAETPLDGAFTAQPPVSAAEGERIFAGSTAIRERMNAIDPDDPSIKGLTVGAWLERQGDPLAAKAAFNSMIEGLWCRPIGEIPLWYLIDNDRRITNTVWELQYFPAETMHSLADDLAAELGDRLMLNTAVARIERSSGKIKVHTSSRLFEADQVIVAVPPVTASRIAYRPALPEPLSRALNAWKSGTVMKGQFRYARAFWRDKGLNGMVAWRDIHGLFAHDNSRDADHPTLVVYIGGPLAVEWRRLGEAGIRAELARRLVTALGPEAEEFLAFTLRDWVDDRWSGGGYSDLIMEMDARNAEAVLLEGDDRVQFASSELSPSFPGYVEGAIVAGKIAAERALHALAEQDRTSLIRPAPPHVGEPSR
ncbi:flavin monoamine oxidase family protein [Mesorhizobium sp. BAC0120]|uniref:flavin monoamine oxidase family protein n=1 Tax=Mesorhizobium sp. BAC0120 TaxID=3090670 RepID=UPI00298CE51D|nr:flavin monoamine oxidase family protein [Mesorhizobium sp. BAC0120]MDW6021704.1 flavin monoamine oxidase family protein [Mesorhizobium sp. BAC0120]